VSGVAGAIEVAILGATGRMGQSVLRLFPEFPQLRLHAAVVSSESRSLGHDACELTGMTPTGIALTADLDRALRGAALAMDFSTAAAAPRHVPMCAEAGIPLLIGTTGLGPDMTAILTQASERIAVLVAANTSLGAAVLETLVRCAAVALGTGFDIHVQDPHHRNKKDAPSGTALALGRAATEARGGNGGVEYRSVRAGEVVGEHEVEFLGQGERLRLDHAVADRAVFARGALQAGLWLLGQNPGIYRMADIFNEK